MKMKEWKVVVLLIGMAILAVSCGGGGGGGDTTSAAAAQAVPTDAATITTTGTKQLVQSFSTIVQPDGGYSSPKTMMRSSGRAMGRLAGAVTSDIDSMTGTVGETFTITFTNEPADKCTANGTMTGELTSVVSPTAIITLDGTLNFTNCTDGTPDHTGVIIEGHIKLEVGTDANTMEFAMRMRYTFSGTGYYTTMGVGITYYDPKNDGSDKWNLDSEIYTGTDSLSNTLYVLYEYERTDGHIYRYYNKSVIGGTTINFGCIVGMYPVEKLYCYGSSTLNNGIVLNFDPSHATSSGDRIVINVMESNDCTDDINAYHVTLQNSTGTFATNVGYTGTVTGNADGSSSGTLVNAGGTTVATFSCDTSGMCSVDYTDTALADEQYYATNILDALK